MFYPSSMFSINKISWPVCRLQQYWISWLAFRANLHNKTQRVSSLVCGRRIRFGLFRFILTGRSAREILRIGRNSWNSIRNDQVRSWSMHGSRWIRRFADGVVLILLWVFSLCESFRNEKIVNSTAFDFANRTNDCWKRTLNHSTV